MAQQTAVEWLMKQLLKYGFISVHDLKQAKEMEKEQIIYSNYNGQSVGKKLIDIHIHQMITKAEQYYNETYNK
jgi:hypothetical protein